MVKMDFEYYLKFPTLLEVYFILQFNFLGKLIKKGKKEYALKLFSNLKYYLKKKTKQNPNFLILVAVLNSLLKINFIKKRFGGKIKEIPVPLDFKRQIKFAITEILYNVQTKKSINVKKLVNLICFCFKNEGPVMRHNNVLYRKAIENKVLLHFIKR